MRKAASVLMFGTLPPPVGGVTISVENLTKALRKSGVQVTFISLSMLFKRFDIAHIHSYSAWKRFLLLLAGKLLAKKCVFTIHGMHYPSSGLLSRVNLWLSDGVIVLNDKILATAPILKSKPLQKMTSIVSEGVELDFNPNQQLLPKKSKPRILLYAQHGNSFQGQAIYGVPFIESILSDLISKYTLVFVDATGCYPQMSAYQQQDVYYINKPVNFLQLLSEVDVYIRPTSKDGDAVSIHESMMMGVPVVASDVVERAGEVLTYRYLDRGDFLSKLANVLKNDASPSEVKLDSVQRYLSFYGKLLNT